MKEQLLIQLQKSGNLIKIGHYLKALENDLSTLELASTYFHPKKKLKNEFTEDDEPALQEVKTRLCGYKDTADVIYHRAESEKKQHPGQISLRLPHYNQALQLLNGYLTLVEKCSTLLSPAIFDELNKPKEIFEFFQRLHEGLADSYMDSLSGKKLKDDKKKEHLQLAVKSYDAIIIYGENNQLTVPPAIYLSYLNAQEKQNALFKIPIDKEKVKLYTQRIIDLQSAENPAFRSTAEHLAEAQTYLKSLPQEEITSELVPPSAPADLPTSSALPTALASTEATLPPEEIELISTPIEVPAMLLNACKQGSFEDIMKELEKPNAELLEQATDEENKGKNILHFLASRGSSTSQPVLTKEQIITIFEKIKERCVQKAKREGKLENDYLKILINTTCAQQNTPLHSAAACGFFILVSILLNNGAEIRANNAENKTPLHCAVESGQEDIVRVLLNKINLSTNERASLMKMALSLDDKKIVDLLTTRQAKLFNLSYSPHTNTPLHDAARSGNNEELLRLFAEGYIPNHKNENDETALHICAREKNLSGMRLLLDFYARTSLKNLAGFTALHLAAEQGDFEAVTLLAEKSRKETIQKLAENRSVLHILAHRAAITDDTPKEIKLNAFKALTKSGADFNEEQTPETQNIPLVVYLLTCKKFRKAIDNDIFAALAHGIDFSKPINRYAQQNILHYLAMFPKADLEKIKPLLGNININHLLTQLNTDKVRPVKRAIEEGNLSFIQHFITPANVNNPTDSFDDTPIIDAIFFGQIEIAQALLDLGASRELRNNRRLNAYDYLERNASHRKAVSSRMQDLIRNYKPQLFSQPRSEVESSPSNNATRKRPAPESATTGTEEALDEPRTPEGPEVPRIPEGDPLLSSAKDAAKKSRVSTPAESQTSSNFTVTNYSERFFASLSAPAGLSPAAHLPPPALSTTISSSPITVAEPATAMALSSNDLHPLQAIDALLRTKNQEITGLREQASAHASALERLEREAASNKRKLMELTTTYEHERATLHATINGLKAERNNLQQELRAALEQLKASDSQIAAMQSTVASTRQLLGSLLPNFSPGGSSSPTPRSESATLMPAPAAASPKGRNPNHSTPTIYDPRFLNGRGTPPSPSSAPQPSLNQGNLTPK